MTSEGSTSLVPVKRKVGAPKGSGSKYTEEIAEEICDRMIHGETLISICRVDRDGNPRNKADGWPHHMTVYDWADPRQPGSYHPDFEEKFARAKLGQERYWIEETIDISNNPEPGIEEVYQESEKLGVSLKRVRKDMFNHRALKIETRFKAAAKLNPQLWAERLQQAAPQDTVERQALVIEGGLPDNEPPPPKIPNDSSPSEEEKP